MATIQIRKATPEDAEMFSELAWYARGSLLPFFFGAKWRQILQEVFRLYYGYYSNVSRGKRKKQDQDGLIPSILEEDRSSKEHRKNWARLIQKIYEVDPLTCPKCSSSMKVISVIEDEEVIQKILKHLGLWDRKARPPPKPKQSQWAETYIDYSYSQLLPSGDHLFYDPDYSAEGWIEDYAS